MKKTFLFLALIAFIFNVYPQISDRNTNDWTILASYNIPGKASGLAWDGQYLYSGLYSAPGDDNVIYKINPSDGSYTVQCYGPHEKAYGLTYDNSSGNLWTTEHPGAYDPGIAVEFDMSGNYVSEFDLPATYFSGIAYDNGDYWTTCYYDPDGEVFLLDDDGTVIDQFATPGNQPWDICKQGNNLWIADYDDNKLYKIDDNGTLLESHDSENVKPAGIVFDGTYLWYIDGGLQVESTLYKIDLTGSGNPDINIPQTFHDFGVVTLNNTETWACLIQNNGGAALQVTYGDIYGEGSQYIAWPEGNSFTVDANSNKTIYISYTPLAAGSLDAYAILETNDPVTPDVELHMVGIAVNPGPYLYIPVDNNDFGEVRIDAHTRWEMEIENKGDETLIVNSINFSDTSHFYAEQRDTLPMSLEPLESRKIGIWFTPDDKGEFNASVEISSNDVNQDPFIVQVSGEGLAQDWPMGTVFWNYTIMAFSDSSPKAIQSIGDVTGDGVDDVVICSEDNFIRCFNGNAHGSGDVIWETEIYSGNVYNQNSIGTIPDTDNDGYDEIIVGTTGGDRSIIAISGYSGEIIWKHQTNEYGDGGWVYQVFTAYDFNEDDFPDVLAATGDDSGDNGPKRVYCLNGRTGETIWESPRGGPVFSVIGIEDFTGDGHVDVLAGASNESESEGYVYGLDGTNGTEKWKFITQSTSVWALAQLDDVNESGSKDFMLGDFGGQYYIVDPVSLYIIHTSGIGNYLILRFVVMDDITQDGFKDVLVAHSGKKAVILDGAGGGEFVNTPLDDKSWCVARIGDLSGDGKNDIVVGSLFENNHVYMIGSSHGNIMFEDDYVEPIDAISSTADINNDGSMEMIVGGRFGKVVCYSGGLDAAVGIEQGRIPAQNKLVHGSYPNPFSDETNIYFELENTDHITLQIRDLQGRLLETIVDETLIKGSHKYTWNITNTSNLKKGIYFYNINTSVSVVSGKLVLVN